MQRERVDERLQAVGRQKDDRPVESCGREQRAARQQHVVHKLFAQRVAEERGARGEGKEVSKQLLGQLRLIRSSECHIAHVHGGQFLVVGGGVEEAVALKLLVDGSVAVLQVLGRKGAGNELGAVGAVSALGEEEIVICISGLLAHQAVGGEVIGDEEKQCVRHGKKEIGTNCRFHQFFLTPQ